MTFETKLRPPLHRSLLARLRSWFFTGLVIFGPVAVTVYITLWFIDSVDNWVRPLAPASLWPDTYLPFHVPGFGVVIVIIGLTLLGFLAANIAGRTLVALYEAMLDRTPVVRGIYKSVKQIFETVFSQGGTQFRKVGLVEFPLKGSWSVVFISSDPAPGGRRSAAERRHDLGVPALHPQSDDGFLFLRADQGHHRTADVARRRGEADHVGGPHPARRAGRARGDGAGGEAGSADRRGGDALRARLSGAVAGAERDSFRVS